MPKISFKKIKEAIISYDLDFIKECVENNSFDINTSDRGGWTGLSIAIEHIVGSSLSYSDSFHSGLSCDYYYGNYADIDLEKTYRIAKYFCENGYKNFETPYGKGFDKYTLLGYVIDHYGYCPDSRRATEDLKKSKRSAEEQKEYNFKLIKLLIKNGADINNQEAKSPCATPLMIAVENNYLTIVQYLVENGVSINQKSDPVGETALHIAGKNPRFDESERAASFEIVKFLMEKGADPNITYEGYVGNIHHYPKTPLHHSCEQENSNFELITFLVENGTDPKIITDPEYSPVPLTCKSENDARKCYDYFTEKFPEILKNETFINNYLLQVANNRQYGIMLVLLSHGADINTTGRFGETPLLNFMQGDSIPSEHPFSKKTATIDCIYSLIEQGAEIDVRDKWEEDLLKIFVQSTLRYWETYELDGKNIRRYEDDCGYDIDGKGFEFFKYLINKGIPFNEKHGGRDESVKDILFNGGIVDWLNYLEELENKGQANKPMTINIDDPVECEILFVGTEMQKELGIITYKNGKESDGYKIGSEKGSWTFKWKLPHSKEAMFDVLNKGTNWAYYFDGSFKEKWHEELPGVDFDDSEWHGGNGLALLDNKIFDINGNEVDEEKIKDYYTAHDTESISFNPSYQSEIKIKDNNSNWVSFSLSNNMWKMLTGTGKSGKETTIESELIPEKGFDLVKKIKDIFGWNDKSMK